MLLFLARNGRQEKAFYQWLESLPSSCQLVLLQATRLSAGRCTRQRTVDARHACLIRPDSPQVGASNNEETMRVQRAAQGFAQSKLIRDLLLLDTVDMD